MPTQNPAARSADRLLLVRHGATEPNLAGVRCGGDLDVPLTATGRAQARAVAQRLADAGIGVVVTSDLQRTRETATIIAAALGGLEVVVEPGFAERRLGTWNLLPVASTEHWIRERRTPPGGESDAAFIARIGDALPHVLPWLPRRPLLVASKGVARALGELLHQVGGAGLANGDVAQFDLAPFLQRQPASCTA